MNFVLFYHSFSSCWNHGNAHFLRGITRTLIQGGHAVRVYEPADGWSRINAIADDARALAEAEGVVPGADIRPYCLSELDLDAALDDADVVIAHEWNDAELIAALGRRRRESGKFLLFFHDTHHRAASAPHEIERFDLDGYDAVLAFGEVLRETYRRHGWARRAFTWHEAADIALFHPLAREKDADLVFIGNWGDGERSVELRQFLFAAIAPHLAARIHGVRYPKEARAEFEASGIDFAGWLPNHRVPEAYARARATLHVPRRPYSRTLVGIPTVRVFEALACAIPLITAPWQDVEGLFPPECFLMVGNGDAAREGLARILADASYAAHLANRGLAAIRERHTCAHRVSELFAIIAAIADQGKRAAAATRNVQEGLQRTAAR